MTDGLSTAAILLGVVVTMFVLPGIVGFLARPQSSWIVVPAAASGLAIIAVITVFVIASVGCSPDCSDADLGYGVGLVALGPITFVVVLPGLVIGKVLGQYLRGRRSTL